MKGWPTPGEYETRDGSVEVSNTFQTIESREKYFALKAIQFYFIYRASGTISTDFTEAQNLIPFSLTRRGLMWGNAPEDGWNRHMQLLKYLHKLMQIHVCTCLRTLSWRCRAKSLTFETQLYDGCSVFSFFWPCLCHKAKSSYRSSQIKPPPPHSAGGSRTKLTVRNDSASVSELFKPRQSFITSELISST